MGTGVQLIGHLISGRGNAQQHVLDFKSELEAKIGTTIFKGTMNVILSRPILLSCEGVMKFDRGRRLVWPARMGSTQVWLYRWPNAPLHIVEVLAEKRIRDAWDLEDGDQVRIDVPSEFIRSPSLVKNALWAIYWLGRKDWAYTNDRYYFGTKTWCARLGIIQGRCC